MVRAVSSQKSCTRGRRGVSKEFFTATRTNQTELISEEDQSLVTSSPTTQGSGALSPARRPRPPSKFHSGIRQGNLAAAPDCFFE